MKEQIRPRSKEFGEVRRSALEDKMKLQHDLEEVQHDLLDHMGAFGSSCVIF